MGQVPKINFRPSSQNIIIIYFSWKTPCFIKSLPFNSRNHFISVPCQELTPLSDAHELHGLGYSICSFATSGEKAIEIAEQEKPDIMVMDIRLIGEMDGFVAVREWFLFFASQKIRVLIMGRRIFALRDNFRFL